MFLCLQAVWSCGGRQILFWRRNQMWKVRKVIIWEFFYNLGLFMPHFALFWLFDSSRDPRHSASVQLVVNSNYPWSSISNTAARWKFHFYFLNLKKCPSSSLSFRDALICLLLQKSLSLYGFRLFLIFIFKYSCLHRFWKFHFLNLKRYPSLSITNTLISFGKNHFHFLDSKLPLIFTF